jgi:SWI/SNF-related matrix-associated actin-dependent regulator 1 of chromatin subfamily A
LLADQQGLGKTLQALAYLQRNPSIRPAVVVCPASLKLNWKAETEKWTTIKAEVVKGTKPYQTKAELIIINYDIVHCWIETLRKTEFKCLILDESVAIKESTARRTKAVKRLAKGIQHIIALSGTPILNRPSEIYNTLTLVSPGLFDSPGKFKRRYCDMKYNGFGWDYSGASHIPELHTILTSTVMLRRLKENVLKDLPDKLFSFVPIEIDNEEEYIKAESDFIAYIREKKGDEKALRAERAQQFAKIEVLKQLSVKGKIKASIDWINNLLSVDGKLVVFCSHHFVVDELMTKFKSIAVKLDGRDTAIEKNKSVERFQNEEKIRLFVGNIKAAGQGLTLTASSNVAFMEYPWSPADLQQCADRCHRIGQKDTVNVYYLHGNNTIEERLIRILDRKKLVLDAMLDGIDTQEENLLTEIIKSYI